jgi:hypothetical protein
MTKEDILQALRLTAMGRAGHPLQEQLADELAKVFAAPTLAAMVPPMQEAVALAEAIQADAPKKRTKKAD